MCYHTPAVQGEDIKQYCSENGCRVHSRSGPSTPHPYYSSMGLAIPATTSGWFCKITPGLSALGSSRKCAQRLYMWLRGDLLLDLMLALHLQPLCCPEAYLKCYSSQLFLQQYNHTCKFIFSMMWQLYSWSPTYFQWQDHVFSTSTVAEHGLSFSSKPTFSAVNPYSQQ